VDEEYHNELCLLSLSDMVVMINKMKQSWMGLVASLGGKDNLVQSFDVEHLRQRREGRANVEFLETGLQGVE